MGDAMGDGVGLSGSCFGNDQQAPPPFLPPPRQQRSRCHCASSLQLWRKNRFQCHQGKTSENNFWQPILAANTLPTDSAIEIRQQIYAFK
jgi:hypothetical protein